MIICVVPVALLPFAAQVTFPVAWTLDPADVQTTRVVVMVQLSLETDCVPPWQVEVDVPPEAPPMLTTLSDTGPQSPLCWV